MVGRQVDKRPRASPPSRTQIFNYAAQVELEQFARLDLDAPLAVASIAQVHSGQLHDGTPIVVKVLRSELKK